MKQYLYLLCLLAMFFPPASVFADEDVFLNLEDGLQNLSEEIRSKKITIVQFLPLPFKSPDNKVPHERVFTDEFYSASPTEKNFEGEFIPHNYLEIFRNNIHVLKKRYNLHIDIAENLIDVPVDTDYIIFGSVQEFVSDREKTTVSLFFQLLEAHGIKPITSKMITKKLMRSKGIPIEINKPIHTLGNLGNDFRQERYTLNLAAYMALADIIKLLDESVISYEIEKTQ